MRTIYVVTDGDYERKSNIRAFATMAAAEEFKQAEEAKERAHHDHWEAIHEANGYRPAGRSPWLSEWSIEELELVE
jgi:hypothetical protein